LAFGAEDPDPYEKVLERKLIKSVPDSHHHGLSDPDPASDPASDPSLFVNNFQDANKNSFCLILFEDTFASFFRNKSHKEVTKQ
jgi:hypothetical protein